MIVYGLLLITLIVAAVSLICLYKLRGKKTYNNWSLLLLSVSLGIFIYLYGTWVFLSVYTKYVFATCYIVLFIIVIAATKTKAVTEKGKSKLFLNLFFTILFSILSVLYFTGTTGRPYGIANLAFPFKKGNYLVLQGGKGLPTNLFHYSFRGAVYAIDLIKLNSFGNRAK